MTETMSEQHYIYEIGVNQGTAESWSRGYDGNWTMEDWAQHHALHHDYTYVELVPEQVYMFMQGDRIMEVRWLISKEPISQEELESWGQLDDTQHLMEQ